MMEKGQCKICLNEMDSNKIATRLEGLENPLKWDA
jgi:hypothetical protein